ncbi:MAG: hypothetical protein ACJAQ0_000095 [Dasania sp.]|jgi:hypothetical protein
MSISSVKPYQQATKKYNSPKTHEKPAIKEYHKPSIPEKIINGDTINDTSALIQLSSEKGAKKLAEQHAKQGGISYDLNRYKDKMTKDDLKFITEAIDFEGLKNGDDIISSLSYKQLKNLFDHLKLIVDDEKLEKTTGISDNIDKEKEFFVTKRLLPDPIEQAEKGKGATLWTEDEKKLLADIKIRKNFQYVQKNLIDGNIHHDFLDPYEGLSNVAKDMLRASNQPIDTYLDTLPYEKQEQIENMFFDNKMLNRYTRPTHYQSPESVTMGALPNNYQSLDSSFLQKHFSYNPSKIEDFKLKSQGLLNKNNYHDIFHQTKNMYFT